MTVDRNTTIPFSSGLVHVNVQIAGTSLPPDANERADQLLHRVVGMLFVGEPLARLDYLVKSTPRHIEATTSTISDHTQVTFADLVYSGEITVNTANPVNPEQIKKLVRDTLSVFLVVVSEQLALPGIESIHHQAMHDLQDRRRRIRGHRTSLADISDDPDDPSDGGGIASFLKNLFDGDGVVLDLTSLVGTRR